MAGKKKGKAPWRFGCLVVVLTCGFLNAAEAASPLACFPAKPAVLTGETIELRVRSPEVDVSFAWSADAGRISGAGARVLWEFEGVATGSYTAKVSAKPRTGSETTCVLRVEVMSAITVKGEVAARRSLLVKGAHEPKSYGLYSYLLLKPEAGLERNLAALTAYWQKIIALAELDKARPTQRIHLSLVPVQARIAGDAQPAQVIKLYDHDRALRLLENLEGTGGQGPFIIASPVPMPAYRGGPLLRYDLSAVPNKNLRLWVGEFVDQSGQEDFTRPNALAMFHLQLRTIVGSLSEGLPKGLAGLGMILVFSGK